MEEIEKIRKIIDFFKYHNKNLTNEQCDKLIDLEILTDGLEMQITKDIPF